MEIKNALLTFLEYKNSNIWQLEKKFEEDDQEIERPCWKVWTLHAGPKVFISIEYTSCDDVIFLEFKNLVVFCFQTISTIKFLLT